MSGPNLRRASLSEIRRMRDKGELVHDPKAPEGESLGPDFWAEAKVEEARKPRSVHLRLDQDVFDFFWRETGGKGHLTRMQNVVRSYVNARRRASSR